MDIRDEILINRVVQDLDPIEPFMLAFTRADAERRTELLQAAIRMAEQAGLQQTDVEGALASSGVSPRKTSAVLFGKSLRTNFWRVSSLPQPDLDDAMRLVLALFRVADNRRRATRCARGCSHWWHGDLSDVDAVIAAAYGKSPK